MAARIKRENTLTSLARALLRIENFFVREHYLEYQVRDQTVKNISKSDQNGGQYGGQKKAGKHINVSGSRIITNREFS